jgi:hypothetical protein
VGAGDEQAHMVDLLGAEAEIGFDLCQSASSCSVVDEISTCIALALVLP